MKKNCLFAIIFTVVFSLYAQPAREQGSLESASRENDFDVKGDIFFDCTFGLDFCFLNTKSMLSYIEENRTDVFECICSVPYYVLFDAICLVCCSGELVYYRKENDDGSHSNYFGMGYPLNMTMALYFSNRFYTGIKLGLDCDFCIGNGSFEIAPGANSSLMIAFEPVSLNAGIRAGYFDNEWYAAPFCSINIELYKEVLLSLYYMDANFFGKDIRRLSLGCTLLLCKN